MPAETVKILLVEDNDADARLISEYLTTSNPASFEVKRAKNLSDAIKVVQGKQVDVALLDLDLPDSRGLETLIAVVNESPQLPVVVLTGFDDEKFGIEMLQEGAQDYLVKGSIQGYILLRSMFYAIERKKMEDILKRDRETLKKLVEDKANELLNVQLELDRAKRLSDIGTLAATVAHELRNPLAAISMAVHNIKRKAKNPALDSHLANIEKKVSESDQIINNLLFYSRIRPPHYENINMFDLIEESVDYIEANCKKPISVVKDINRIKDIKMEADPIQIKEVIHNIVNNACDSLPDKGGRVEITGMPEDNSIVFIVRDNGHGIDKDYLTKVFDPFFTTKAKGTGLGLSVCLQVVSLHNGSISIQSEPGRGTSVTVRLPRKSNMRSA